HGPGAAGSGDQDDVRFRPPPSPIEVRYSRFRGGPTSMGAVGRLLTSVLAILLAAAVYMYLFPVMLGESGGRGLVLFGGVAVAVRLVVLRRVWRPTRIG